MEYFVKGLRYGVMAFGGLLSFTGGVVVLVSICSFMAWVGEKINPDAEEICEDEDDE